MSRSYGFEGEAISWICDEGGMHWTGNPCDCEPEESNV